MTPTNPDIDGAIASITFGHAGQFTPVSVSGGTNYTAGLEAASTIAQAATGGSDINVVFLSDGLSNLGGAGFSAALAHLAGEATIHPFAVGPEANCAAGSQGTLAAMAEASGTLCHDAPNPANLPDVIKNVTATTLSSVAVTLDGAPVAASVVPTVPTSGPASVAWTAQGTDLAPGTHQVCATASGVGPSSNPAATGSVTRCETFDVYAFALAPPTATNELGVDDTHMVTATLSGPSGKLAGHGVAFAVSGVNAGESGTCAPASCTTDAAGRVTFTYDVPKEPASLGDDTIRATVTVGAESVALTVAKSWVDTTPPVARCVPTTNPGGHIPRAPGNGGQGQNQDGFYRLVATDDVWPTTALDLTVSDAATGTEFGPFAVDTDVKWTQANGAAPSQKPGSGDVEWRLKGQGDMVLVAVDGSGNRSAPVTCLEPNPPK